MPEFKIGDMVKFADPGFLKWEIIYNPEIGGPAEVVGMYPMVRAQVGFNSWFNLDKVGEYYYVLLFKDKDGKHGMMTHCRGDRITLV